MKLVRYGALGAEKPGIIDANGVLRDLSDHVADIAGETLSDPALQALRAFARFRSRQFARGHRQSAHRCLRWQYWKIPLHWFELCRSRRRNWSGHSRASDFVL